MLKESPVLDSQHGVNQNLRHFVVVDHLALRSLVTFKKRGDHLGFEFVGVKLIAGTSGNALDSTFSNTNSARLGAVIGAWAGRNFNRASGNMVAAHGRRATLIRVPGMAECRGNLLQISLLSHTEGVRSRVNLGRIGKDRALETGLDDTVVLDVKIREK